MFGDGHGGGSKFSGRCVRNVLTGNTGNNLGRFRSYAQTRLPLFTTLTTHSNRVVVGLAELNKNILEGNQKAKTTITAETALEELASSSSQL